MIECLWSSEEFELRSRHRLSIQQLEFFKVQGANQIRKLKEAVFIWAYVLNELNWAGDTICNLIMEKLRNWRLSAIIIDLHNLKFRQQLMLLSQKLGQRQTQLIHNLVNRRDKLLINAQTVIFEIDAMRKGHHPREDSTAEMSIKDRVLLLLANQRPRMKTMVLYSNVILNPIKILNVLLYVL